MNNGEGLWVRGADGTPEFLYYSELDTDVKGQLLKPVGGFIFSANDFLDLDLPKPPFYIKDWLPQKGKMMLFAPAKSGKSFLCFQIARTIGAGSDFLGLPTIQGKVLYIQFELGEEVLRGRLMDTKKSYDNVYVGTSFSLKLDTEEGKAQLTEAVNAVSPDVLIIDPLYKAIMGDENIAQDMMKVLNFLDSLIKGFGCSIILIHHSGKDESKYSRGSSVFPDWVDSYVKMQRINKDSENLRIKLTPVLLRHAAPGDPIIAEMRDYEFCPLEGANLTIKQAIEAFINSIGKPVCPKDLFDLKMGSNAAVHNALKDLVKEGKIAKPEVGVYEKIKGGK
jgi:hypothetical protein